MKHLPRYIVDPETDILTRLDPPPRWPIVSLVVAVFVVGVATGIWLMGTLL